MRNEVISEKDLTEERTPSELRSWVRQKMDQIYYSSDKSRRALTLHNKGLEKRLKEEVLPLAIFAEHKFGDSDLVRLQPVIGSQPYDAVVKDRTTDPPTESFIEITLSHEGRDNYLRRCQLLEKGYVPPYAPVIKTRTKRGWAFSIPAEATSVVERVENERQRILAAAKRKEGKKYLPSTSLVIFFDDARPFQEEMDNVRLDSFVTSNILNLDQVLDALSRRLGRLSGVQPSWDHATIAIGYGVPRQVTQSHSAADSHCRCGSFCGLHR